MFEYEDKIVLITGAGRGRGRMLAQALSKSGALIAVNDISPINLDPLVVIGNGRVKAYGEDVAKKVRAQSIVDEVQEDFGRIDVLINHAAVQSHIPPLEMDEWDWHRVLDVNLTGAFLMIQSVGRVMRSQGSGVIVNLITESTRDEKEEEAFLAGMRGLEALSDQAAREYRLPGIRVYTVADAEDTIVDRVPSLITSEEP